MEVVKKEPAAKYGGAENQVECKVCGERVSRHYINNHMDYHRGRKFICNACGADFPNRRGLTRHRHKYGHGVGKPVTTVDRITCDRCDFSCDQFEDLYSHKTLQHQDSNITTCLQGEIRRKKGRPVGSFKNKKLDTSEAVYAKPAALNNSAVNSNNNSTKQTTTNPTVHSNAMRPTAIQNTESYSADMNHGGLYFHYYTGEENQTEERFNVTQNPVSLHTVNPVTQPQGYANPQASKATHANRVVPDLNQNTEISPHANRMVPDLNQDTEISTHSNRVVPDFNQNTNISGNSQEYQAIKKMKIDSSNTKIRDSVTSELFKCPKCESVFRKEMILQKHLQLHNKNINVLKQL